MPPGIKPMAVPRDPGSATRKAWDAEVPPHLADSLTFSWKLRSGMPSFKSAEVVKVRSVSSKEPTQVAVSGSMTVDELKKEIARTLHVSSRKAMTLLFYGTELDGAKSLDQNHVRDGALLDVTFKSRSQAELDTLKALKHVLLIEGRGDTAIVLENLSPSTLVSTIKATLKAPPTAQLFHSPVFSSNFGAALLDERTLGSYGVLGACALRQRAPSRQTNAVPRGGGSVDRCYCSSLASPLRPRASRRLLAASPHAPRALALSVGADGDIIHYSSGEEATPAAEAAPPKKK